MLSWFGFDFGETPRSWLVALRFFFDALFPFLVLFIVSAVTPPVAKVHLDRLYAKLHTPVQPTPEADRAALEAAYADPGQFEPDKLRPGSSWEVMRPSRLDYLGFLGSWALVGVVVLLLWVMVSIR